jgi:replicative superfamily II helicase
MEETSKKVELFVIFEIEFVNENTGQMVSLTTTCGNYKELGKYLTEMGKKQWRMVPVTRKKN